MPNKKVLITHTQEKVFLKKLGAVSQEQAEISVPNWSYIYARKLLSHKNS